MAPREHTGFVVHTTEVAAREDITKLASLSCRHHLMMIHGAQLKSIDDVSA